jgi:hypothetical protein
MLMGNHRNDRKGLLWTHSCMGKNVLPYHTHIHPQLPHLITNKSQSINLKHMAEIYIFDFDTKRVPHKQNLIHERVGIKWKKLES